MLQPLATALNACADQLSDTDTDSDNDSDSDRTSYPTLHALREAFVEFTITNTSFHNHNHSG